jgi:hypothetical protein
MDERRRAARALISVAAVLLLAAALATTSGSPDSGRAVAGERFAGFGILPVGEGSLTSPALASIGERSRGIERSRPLHVPAVAGSLTILLSFVAFWRCLLGRRDGAGSLPSRQRVAGPRAPPLQLA